LEKTRNIKTAMPRQKQKKKYMKKLIGCQDTYESGKREISTQWAYTTSIIYLDSPLAHKKGKNN
jgi:hypothetical protein